MHLDSFYTPRKWAERLVSAGTSTFAKRVADFAAGDGSLLEAAESRWPQAKVVAVDADHRAVKRLKARRRSWDVRRADFLAMHSAAFLTELRGKVDVVVLNPPFSCKGGEFLIGDVFGEKVRCSRSLAFVLCSLPYLTPNGEVLAVMPRSVLRSRKDAVAMGSLRQHFCIEVHDEIPRGEFGGCAATAVIVALLRRQHECIRPTIATPRTVQVLRGSCQMHSFMPSRAKNALPLIHTTDIRGGEVSSHTRVQGGRRFNGPGVLLPRVGRPDREKIAAVDGSFVATLSDCVMMLPTSDDASAIVLVDLLKSNWERLEALYSSTGAPYVTIESLGQFVATLVSNPSVTKSPTASRRVGKRTHLVPLDTGNRRDH